MNFLKPTKSKIFGTLIVYFTEVLTALINSIAVSLLYPKAISEAVRNIGNVGDALDTSSPAIFLVPVIAFIVKIILFYLAVCFIVHLMKRQSQFEQVALRSSAETGI